MFITNKLPETLVEETPVAWSLSRKKTKQTFNFKAVISIKKTKTKKPSDTWQTQTKPA